MVGLSLLTLVFLPAAVLSLALAFIPWRPPLLCAVLSLAQVVAVVAVALLVPPSWEVWLAFLGPGAAVAAVRGINAAAVVRANQR
jgi:uncharacterized membrane protein